MINLQANEIRSDQKRIIADRLISQLLLAAHFLLIRGATPVEIDNALTEFGFSKGPLEMQDSAGLETAYLHRKSSGADRKSRSYLESGLMISDRMVQEGRLGKVCGVGWYRYPGGKGKVEDPLLEDLIREEAYFAGIEQQEFSNELILAMMLRAMIKESQKIVLEDESITLADIDRILVVALNFPENRGSMMQYADRIGIAVAG